MGGNHTGIELDVPLQVEPVGDVVQIAHDLRLAWIAFGPFPLAHQLGGERVPVDMAFGVASCAGVAVPIPGSAHAAARFERLHRQAETIAEAKQLVEAGETRTNYQRIVFDD